MTFKSHWKLSDKKLFEKTAYFWIPISDNIFLGSALLLGMLRVHFNERNHHYHNLNHSLQPNS